MLMEQIPTSSKVALSTLFYSGSLIFYGLGLYFPIFSSSTSLLGFTLQRESYRLTDSIHYFLEHEDLFLAMVILVFTLVFPVLKYVDLGVRLFSPNTFSHKFIQILKHLDKWSMIDVFLVALLILNFKLDTSMISMELQMGTTFIAISVVLRILASHFIDKNYLSSISGNG